MKWILFFALMLTASFLPGQELSFGAGYFGINVREPGFIVNTELTTPSNKTFDIVYRLEYARFFPNHGLFTYYERYSNTQMDFSVGLSTAVTKRIKIGTGLGLGTARYFAEIDDSGSPWGSQANYWVGSPQVSNQPSNPSTPSETEFVNWRMMSLLYFDIIFTIHESERKKGYVWFRNKVNTQFFPDAHPGFYFNIEAGYSFTFKLGVR